MAENKLEALNTIVSLVKEYSITSRDIEEALDDGGLENKKVNVFVKLFIFFGAILIISGIGIYISMFWNEMNSAERILISLGTGIMLLVLAIFADKDKRFIVAATPLFLMSSFLQPMGMMVTFYEIFPEFYRAGTYKYISLTVAGTMALQLFLIFKAIKKPALLATCIGFSLLFLATLMDMVGINEKYISVTIGISIISIASLIDKTQNREITPMWYFVGSILFYIGLFNIVRGGIFETLYIGACCFLMYISVAVRSKVLLTVTAIASMSYISYFAKKYFINSVGLPLTLIAVGFIFIGISAFSVKIGKQISEE